MKANNNSFTAKSPLVSVAIFARGIGRTPVTIWRWQKLGWLDASVNIAGKPYLTNKAIGKFTRRAAAGEFAKPSHAPRKEKMEAAA